MAKKKEPDPPKAKTHSFRIRKVRCRIHHVVINPGEVCHSCKRDAAGDRDIAAARGKPDPSPHTCTKCGKGTVRGGVCPNPDCY